MSSVSSMLYVICAKFQLVIWALLHNRFDVVFGLTLALLESIFKYGQQTINGKRRCQF